VLVVGVSARFPSLVSSVCPIGGISGARDP